MRVGSPVSSCGDVVNNVLVCDSISWISCLLLKFGMKLKKYLCISFPLLFIIHYLLYEREERLQINGRNEYFCFSSYCFFGVEVVSPCQVRDSQILNNRIVLYLLLVFFSNTMVVVFRFFLFPALLYSGRHNLENKYVYLSFYIYHVYVWKIFEGAGIDSTDVELL